MERRTMASSMTMLAGVRWAAMLHNIWVSRELGRQACIRIIHREEALWHWVLRALAKRAKARGLQKLLLSMHLRMCKKAALIRNLFWAKRKLRGKEMIVRTTLTSNWTAAGIWIIERKKMFRKFKGGKLRQRTVTACPDLTRDKSQANETNTCKIQSLTIQRMETYGRATSPRELWQARTATPNQNKTVRTTASQNNRTSRFTHARVKDFKTTWWWTCGPSLTRSNF